jgi:hypothetical protein
MFRMRETQDSTRKIIYKNSGAAKPLRIPKSHQTKHKRDSPPRSE